MSVKVIFKFKIGAQVRVFRNSHQSYSGVVTIQHVVGDHGNFYDVKDRSGFCRLEREEDLKRSYTLKRRGRKR